GSNAVVATSSWSGPRSLTAYKTVVYSQRSNVAVCARRCDGRRDPNARDVPRVSDGQGGTGRPAAAGYSRLMPLMKCSDPGAAGRMLDREIDEAQADVVRPIFTLCPEGEGMKGIAKPNEPLMIRSVKHTHAGAFPPLRARIDVGQVSAGTRIDPSKRPRGPIGSPGAMIPRAADRVSRCQRCV